MPAGIFGRRFRISLIGWWRAMHCHALIMFKLDGMGRQTQWL